MKIYYIDQKHSLLGPLLKMESSAKRINVFIYDTFS